MRGDAQAARRMVKVTGEPSRDTVLIVDDSPLNLQILNEILQKSYVVRAANSGARALEIAGSSPRPDLILLDVMMPGMDGYECLRHLRDNPRTQAIPVIFVTALNSTDDEQKGLEMGAVDYITKPVRPAIVRARVRNHLDLRRARVWLQDQNAILEDELARFLEILAHHLQEPVRRQVTFAQMLQRSLPTPMSECAELSLSEIMSGAAKLRSMLRDVLLFLAVHQTPTPTRPGSSKKAFDTAYREVFAKIRAVGAEVVHGELPNAWIATPQLADVFRALLDNALEYRDQERPPRIHVDAVIEDGKAVFSIADNGIGIPAQYRERVFQVFERLHADSRRSGTGIGLALARKIVEMAGGRIWIEDGERVGTRVRFCLPMAKDACPRSIQ